jgi:type IV pilus assembly protein PilY1
MKPSTSKTFMFIATLVLFIGNTCAEDIDIFGGIGANGSKPNILIIVDNTSSNDASYSSACPYSAASPNLPNGNLLDMVYCALYGTMDGIETQPALLGKLNIGLMSGGSGSNKGGQMYYPSSSPYNLLLMDAAGIASFESIIAAGIPKATGNAKLDQDMQEAWAFFTGNTGPSGTSYSAHIGTVSCQRTFIILIGAASKQGRPCNGTTGCGSASDLAAAGATAAQQVQINTSNLGSNTGDDGSWIDEWARFLYRTDFNNNVNDKQNIVTYTIAAGGDAADYVQVLRSTAKMGGGKAFVGADYASMVQALLQIFNEVAAVNSAFASSSLPVSANSQGTYLNQVFIGMFRPEGNDLPRWAGNLKQYQFGVNASNPANPQLFLADATGAEAISAAGTGFIAPTAVSFWTSKNTSKSPDSIGGFWVNNPQGNSQGFDMPDGEIVDKGGAGQQMRLANLTDDYVANPASPRKVYTCWGTSGLCASGASLSTTPFATTNAALTPAALGITNPFYTESVTNISRVSATGIVTVQLSATPNPTITDATTVTISGSAGGRFDYNLAGKSPGASGTTVTYTLPAELPPTSLVSPSSWTVSGAASGLSNVSSLTRTSNAGLITITGTLADLTFGGSTTVAVGDSLVIVNSTGYNGTGTVTTVNTGTKTVTFTMSETPSVYGGGAKISVGSSTCKTNGQSSTHNCDNFGASNTNAPSAGQASLPGLVRGTNCAGCVANSGNILMVNFPGGTTNLNAVTPATGVQGYVQSGATPSNYVNTTTGWKIVGIGAACTVKETHTDGTVRTYTGTATSSSTYYTLCLDLGAAFAIAPAVVGNGATASPQTTATRQGGYTRTLSNLVRGASSCTGTGSGATANNATVTATTSAVHGFLVGETVQISTASPGTNESTYIGSATIGSVPNSTSFTYTIATTPACNDTTSGMSISYQSSVGATNATDLIRWVRGDDNVGDEQSPGNGITIRPSGHGDVVHSRPTVINYGGSTGIVVFYGANDGVFRAINGNQTASIGSVPPGGELWAFVPQEFFTKLQRLYSNSPQLKMATTPSGITPTPQPKDYYFDGVTGVYQNGSAAYLFLSARRGGRLIYALDVSNPANPKFMWKKGCPNLGDNTGCDAGYSELGETWSQPKVALVKGSTNPVLIFGAGYAPNEDNDPPTAGDTMGRGIFIVDATDGGIVWQAGPGGASNTCQGTPCALLDMTFAIPADITLVNRSFASGGYIDRLYAADTGGNIWRVDLQPTGGNAPANWQVTKLAALGGTGSTAYEKRKFLYPPDVVLTSNFDAVMAATGDREHPLFANQSLSIVNRFYMIKDTNVGLDASGWTAVTDGTSNIADVAPASLFHVTTQYNSDGSVAGTNTYAGTLSGFYITLAQQPGTGEKAVNAPTTIGGSTYFATNQPTNPSGLTCSNNLGTARGYQVNFANGSTAAGEFDGGGLPPSPVAGLVTVQVNGESRLLAYLLGGNPTPGCSGPDCRSSLGGTRPPIPISPIRSRVYWYTQKHDH